MDANTANVIDAIIISNMKGLDGRLDRDAIYLEIMRQAKADKIAAGDLTATDAKRAMTEIAKGKSLLN